MAHAEKKFAKMDWQSYKGRSDYWAAKKENKEKKKDSGQCTGK